MQRSFPILVSKATTLDVQEEQFTQVTIARSITYEIVVMYRKPEEIGQLTVVPANRMSNKGSRPHTNSHKETGRDRRNDANDYNSMLLARGITIDDHCAGRRRL